MQIHHEKRSSSLLRTDHIFLVSGAQFSQISRIGEDDPQITPDRRTPGIQFLCEVGRVPAGRSIVFDIPGGHRPCRMSGADPTRTLIPAELVGQARLLRDRLAPDLAVTRAKIERALRPLREAARSKRPSDWLIRETGRRWQQATADADRIAFYPPACDADGRWAIAEDRPTSADLRLNTWRSPEATGEWDAAAGWPWERGFTVCRFALSLLGRKWRLLMSLEANVSVHALARRVQRGGGTMAGALADTVDAARWAPLCGAADGTAPPLLVPTATGHWRGRLVRVQDQQFGSIALPVLRTWLSDDDVRDDAFLTDLAALRRLGWRDRAVAQPLMQRVLDRISGRH